MALHVTVNSPAIREALEALAEGLVRLNVALIAHADERGVELPPLYETNIRYRREVRREHWQNVVELAASQEGDCEDLSGYRVAELRYFDGEHARVRIVRTARGSFHAVVQREDGTFEDPSRILVEKERAQQQRKQR